MARLSIQHREEVSTEDSVFVCACLIVLCTSVTVMWWECPPFDPLVLDCETMFLQLIKKNSHAQRRGPVLWCAAYGPPRKAWAMLCLCWFDWGRNTDWFGLIRANLSEAEQSSSLYLSMCGWAKGRFKKINKNSWLCDGVASAYSLWVSVEKYISSIANVVINNSWGWAAEVKWRCANIIASVRVNEIFRLLQLL